jgi:hypothetical protein
MPLNAIEEPADKKCLDCGTALGPGRVDRKFCDAACKTNYNNTIKRESREEKEKAAAAKPEMSVPEYMIRIEEILRKNRKILEKFCDEDRVGRIRMRDLIGRGFNTKFFTSQTDPTVLEGNVYRFCFEYGYREEEGGVVVIICRPREVAIDN